MACSKTKLTKSLFLVINFIVWLLGVALTVIGVINRMIASYFLAESQYIFNATNLLITAGVIVAVLGLLGLFAACLKIRYVF